VSLFKFLVRKFVFMLSIKFKSVSNNLKRFFCVQFNNIKEQWEITVLF